MIKLELQVGRMIRTLVILIGQLLLSLTDQSQVAVRIEVVIRLQQHYILAFLCFIVVEVQDCLKVLRFKVLLLKLECDLVSFFKLMVALFKDESVGCNFLNRL